MIKYSIDKENDVVNVTFTGKIELGEIYDFLKAIALEKKGEEEIRLLYDFSDADLSILADNLPEINTRSIETFKSFNLVKSAYVNIMPRETAYTTMYVSLPEKGGHYRQIFNSLETALIWLIE